MDHRVDAVEHPWPYPARRRVPRRRGILVPSPDTPSNELALARAGAEVVPDLGAAAALVALPTAD